MATSHSSRRPARFVNVAQDMLIEKIDCQNILGYEDHELVVCCKDHRSGLHAVVAIHSTARGPALGGCRMWPYASEEEALTDALRLSQAMSRKHAVAKTPHGGGKAIIFGDSKKEKSESLFSAFGRFINQLGGQYITSEDVGISVDDMVVVAKQTEHVVGLPIETGGSGDPSPVTAYGVACGVRAAVAYQAQRNYDPEARLDGVKVAVQGLGHVGRYLCHYLDEAGAQLIVADVHTPNVDWVCRETNAVAVSPDEIYQVEADVFAPCALGSVLNADTIPRLQCSIVAGAANNQLESPQLASQLHDRGILYCVDYVINAGGIINISYENGNYDKAQAMRHTVGIGNTLIDIFNKAHSDKRTTCEVADEIARQRMVKNVAPSRK